MIDLESVYTWILLILIGFNIGVVSGFFGVGGAFVLTPLLNILGLPMASAVGTGLFFAVMVSCAGGIRHYFAGNTIIKASIMLGFLSFIGIRISQPLVIYLDQLNLADIYIRVLYIVLLLLLGISTMLKRLNNAHPGSKQKKLFLLEWIALMPPKIKIDSSYPLISIWLIVLIALVVGFLQGFMGVGGGFILVPLLIIFLDMKPHHAVGTSLLTVVISSIFATYLYFQEGRVVILAALLLGAGSLFGVNFGVRATQNIEGENLKKFYAIFLILTALGIMLKEMQFEIISMIYMLTLIVGVALLIVRRFCFQKQCFGIFKSRDH